MEKEHIYKFLYRLGIILLFLTIIISLVLPAKGNDYELFTSLAILGIYYAIAIPLFLISIILIIISKIKLNKLKKQNEDLSDENV